MHSARNRFAAVLLSLLAVSASAQDVSSISTLSDMAVPPPRDLKTAMALPAKKLFGRQKVPANMPSRAIGTYARGCLAGAKAIPITGVAWQVMRVSRNRNWGHPTLIGLLEDLGSKAKAASEWNGLLVGDLSQPRGGSR